MPFDLGQETRTSSHSSTKPARNLPDFRHGQRTAAGGTTEFFTAAAVFIRTEGMRFPENREKREIFKDSLLSACFSAFLRQFKSQFQWLV
jgi:hypothetical protein